MARLVAEHLPEDGAVERCDHRHIAGVGVFAEQIEHQHDGVEDGGGPAPRQEEDGDNHPEGGEVDEFAFALFPVTDLHEFFSGCG